LIWIEFLICASIVVIAGAQLSKYGDAIAEKTGLTSAWVGLILLATITSMPEGVTAVASVAVGEPDLSLGVVLGSNLFNLSIIVILEIYYRRGPLLSAVSRRSAIPIELYGAIITIAGAGIIIDNRFSDLQLGWVSLFAPILVIAYIVSMRFYAQVERDLQPVAKSAQQSEIRYDDLSLRQTYLRFVVAAAFIVASGIWMANIGEEIAVVTGWEASFVGSLFLAVISSLPELTVCIAALRLGAPDMAIADIIGSNLFNATIIVAVADLFYGPGSILAATSTSQAITALVTLVMAVVVIIGIMRRAKRKTFGVISWESLVIVLLYLFGAYNLFVG